MSGKEIDFVIKKGTMVVGIQMNRSIIKARTFRLFLPGTGSWGKGFPTLRRPRVSSRLCTMVRYPDSPFPHNPPYGTMGLRLLFCLILSIALANSLNDWHLTSVNIWILFIGWYGLVQKFATFVRRSKVYPYKRQVFVYIFGWLTRVVTGSWYLCGIVEESTKSK